MSLTDEPSAPTGPDPAEEEAPEDLAHRLGKYPGLKGLWWAMVLALRELDGKAHRSGLVERIAAMLDLSDEERAEPLPSGTGNYFVFTLDRTAQDLKDRGIIRTPSRGQHTDDLPRGYRELTPLGWRISEAELVAMSHKVTGQDKDPPLQDEDPSLDESLASMVELFRQETGYPTEAHKEQQHLRAEWAEKLSPENVARLSREDLLAYTNNAVDYGTYVARREGLRQQWIIDLDDVQYGKLLESIRDLCWGEDELSTRIDRLVDRVGGFNRDTGTMGFTGLQVSRTLAICHPGQFLPVPSQIGKWGREHMLRALGLPGPHGSYGQRVVDANDQLRDHLAPHFANDTPGMAAFLYWLRKQTLDDNIPSAWMFRGGRDGEFEEAAIEEGLAYVGWSARQLPDLTRVSSREEMAELIRKDLPEWSSGQVNAWVGQLWRLKSEVSRGDIVVMPMKTTSQIAVGVVSDEYWYREDVEPDAPPHVLSVDWNRTDVPRSALKNDLLASLGSQLTICSIRANDAAWRLQQVIETGNDPGPRNESDEEAPDLSVLVEQFHAETDYPTEAHKEQERLRAEWAQKLAPENIADLSRLDLTAVASHGVQGQAKYVYPKVRGVMQWIRVLDDDEYSGLLDQVRYLCWGEDEAWVRYDRLTDRRGAQRVRGLSDLTVVQLLAISRPKSFLPFGPHRGVSSRLLTRLGLNEPRGSSHGQRMVDANNRLLEHLEPHYGDDTLGMAAFLEWLLQQKQPPRPADLDELAHKLLVDAEFLEDIVELLQDKGQVILYGPPGTGKTYLGRALATALAPDEDCRALVQFHPSTSYEDFFEGYRPAGTGDDGNVRYELTPGPLARMAERAEASGQRHVMIIDEINRGNLPRVLGELLFLLEYRDEIVQTLYRPEEEPFSLPDNLWFIGTMNTADRSIALVDAALRRRFHFVPFFPDSGPMEGLLGRWLEREDEPAWVGRLVDAVNDELKEVLGGSHLLLGPSHFMKAYGSSLDTQRRRLRRIWEYNIEPFIEDQFFGDPDQIAHFRFDEVMGRKGPAAESDVDASDDGDEPESTDDAGGEHAAAEGETAVEPGSTPEDGR